MWFHHKKESPAAVPVAKVVFPAAAAAAPALKPQTSPIDKLLRTLETLAIGVITAGALAGVQKLTDPAIWLHPTKAKEQLIAAAVGGMGLYLRNSSWVKRALAAGQAAGTDQ